MVDGASGLPMQESGMFDGAQTKLGSVGANLNILEAEISGGAPSSQIGNNAQALATEARAAGYDDIADAAQNIANSQTDNTYNAGASVEALIASYTQDSSASDASAGASASDSSAASPPPVGTGGPIFF
jgi:hypothetical protein